MTLLLQACNTYTPTIADDPVVTRQTVPGIGACQGLAVHEGSIWLYGDDNGKGVIKRMEWAGPDTPDGPRLIDTRETYNLTMFRDYSVNKRPGLQLPSEPIPHPTGLTFHEDYGTFIGNTVNQKGTIFHLVWWGFKQSGSLDTWVQNVIDDDLANNGTRPEFVRWGGRWLIATADYGDQGNQLRLYDPEKLKTAQKTSDEGVLVAAFECGPFVKSMHWIDETQTLVLAQNQTTGMGYRLTLMQFGDGLEAPVVERVIDLGNPTDELEGFGIIAPGWAVMSSAMKKNNVTVIRWPID
ncbi:MAG: hypothetical protein AAGB26_01135 [Planctomycetota bacterium]